MRFLFVDRIMELSPGAYVRGLKHVTADDFFLTADDSGRHHFMSSLIGETLGQLAAWNVMHYNNFTARPVAGVVSSVQVHRPAYVGDTLLLESFIDGLDERAVQYHSTARVGDEVIFNIEGALGPLLPMTDFISVHDVKKQFEEIFRPANWEQTVLEYQHIDNTILTNEYGCKVAPMLFERVVDFEPGKKLIAEKRISRAAPYFTDHFPNKPVLPMTVLLECKLNLAKEFLLRSQFPGTYNAVEIRKIKMNEFVQPGDVVTCYVTLKTHSEDELILSYRSEVNGKRVCVAEVVLIRQI